MPQVELRIPKELKSWYTHSRQLLASEVTLHSLELACERLMTLTRQPLQGPELESALEAYVELRDGVKEATESMEKVQLMLKVVGENLMSDKYDEDDST